MAFPLVALFSCRGGLSDDLDEDFSTPYSYYSEEHLDDSAAVVERYSIGETITEKDLPTVAQQDFFKMRPGYKILGWKFLKNVLSESSEPPSNIHLNDDDTVSEITVTSAPLAFVVSGWKPITYSVRFRGNGGKTNDGNTEYLQSNFVYDDEQALMPNAFARDNYDFVGWGTEAEHSPNWPVFADEDIVPNLADREGTVVPLYALWLKDKITIHFDSNKEDGDGDEVTEQTFSFKQLPANLAPNSFEREGHTFGYWSTARDGDGVFYADGDEININNYPLDDTTLYAQWNINLYQVEFDSKEGSGVPTQIVEWNQKAYKPENPTRTGYDFEGWYTSADGGDTLSGSPFDFNTPIKAALTLYAKWQMQTLKIHFDKNADDASGKMDDQTIRFDELPVRISANAFDRTSKGYVFDHWNTEPNNTGKSYDDGFEITEDNWDEVRGYAGGDVNLTLYAQWADIKYTVYFESNGGSWIQPQSVDWKKTAPRPADPTRTGYKFLGWDTDNSVQGTLTNEFDFGTQFDDSKYPPPRTLTLYAKWSSEHLVINFDANGGSGEMLSQNVDGSELGNVSISKSTFKRDGCDFIGWSKDKKATTADFADYVLISQSNWDSLHTADEITLYAVWADILYTVYFEANGGEWSNWEDEPWLQREIKWHTSATKPTGLTRTGYKFLGWYEDDTLTNEFDFGTQFDDSKYARYIILYAKWESEKLIINFHANNETGATTTQTITYDQLPVPINATENTFSYEGHDFNGWKTGSGVEYKEITKSNWRSGTLDLYAQWKLKEFTVTFETSSGGSKVASQTVKWNEKATRPAAPTRTGYIFKDWYTSDDGGDTLSGSPFEFSTPIKTNYTLYAKWKAETLIITFHANNKTGATTTQTITYDQLSPSVPINATANTFSYEGHDFNGWNTQQDGKGTEYKEITKSNWRSGTLDLYAQWKLKEFTVTFIDALDSQEFSSVRVNWGATVIPPTLTREHYTFSGWDLDDSSATEVKSRFDSNTPITDDTRLYAKWTPHIYKVTFNGNDATSGSMESQEFTYGVSQSLTPNAFEKSGYNFGGWATSPTATSGTYGDKAIISVESDMLLYAVWSKRVNVLLEVGLKYETDEENERIIFRPGGSYSVLSWQIDEEEYNGNELIIRYDDPKYADGESHSVILIGKDENGKPVSVEIAIFRISPKA